MCQRFLWLHYVAIFYFLIQIKFGLINVSLLLRLRCCTKKSPEKLFYVRTPTFEG